MTIYSRRFSVSGAPELTFDELPNTVVGDDDRSLDHLLPRNPIVPITDHCLKIEHRDGLEDTKLRDLRRILSYADERYPHFRWLLIVEDHHHHDIAAICDVLHAVVPARRRGRIAVVWIGRLKAVRGYAVQSVSTACVCQLFCSAHYGTALNWLNISLDGV